MENEKNTPKQNSNKSSTIAITYLIYIVFWYGLVIGGCAYVVFWLNHSGWWFLLAIILGDFGFSPKEWKKLFKETKETNEEKS
jgi:hypothetical protein